MVISRRYKFRLDHSVERFGTIVLGGSPLRMMRLTAKGIEHLDRIADHHQMPPSPLIDALLDAGIIHPNTTSPNTTSPNTTSPHTPSSPDSHPPPKSNKSLWGPPWESESDLFGFRDDARYSFDDVTVVTPAFNSSGLRLSTSPIGVTRRLIVDDGSRPPIDGAHLRLDVNRGPAAARNAGLAATTTPLVAFIDSDVDVTDLDQRAWECLLAHFDDPKVALVAPRVVSRAGQSRLERYEMSASPLDLGRQPGRIRAGSRIGYVPAAAIICRVDRLREMGGFNEKLRFGEDVDLCWRLDAAGWRCRYEPAVVVRHDPRDSWLRWAKQRIGYGRSAATLAQQHPGLLAPCAISIPSASSWMLVALGHPAAAIAVTAGAASSLVAKLNDVPARRSIRLMVFGTLHSGEHIATAIRRAWWPIVAVTAIASRRARMVLALSIVAARSPLRAIDDGAYSIGVWDGMRRTRTLAPLIPKITSWPGRRRKS